jgi:hypothetical protein
MSSNLSPKQEKILKFLKKYFPHAADFYKAGISHFLNKNMPARLSILSHCFFELSSVFAQTDVNKQKDKMQEILKKTLKNIDFKQENWKEELKKTIKNKFE